MSGRHVVTGWSIHPSPSPDSKEMIYEVKFKRLPGEPSMEEVLRRPYADEVEDYKEYKRLRGEARARQERTPRAKKAVAIMPEVMVHVSQDGTDEWYDEDEDEDWDEGREDSGFAGGGEEY